MLYVVMTIHTLYINLFLFSPNFSLPQFITLIAHFVHMFRTRYKVMWKWVCVIVSMATTEDAALVMIGDTPLPSLLLYCDVSYMMML